MKISDGWTVPKPWPLGAKLADPRAGCAVVEVCVVVVCGWVLVGAPPLLVTVMVVLEPHPASADRSRSAAHRTKRLNTRAPYPIAGCGQL